ncbi:MAG: lysophospholipid acyltransferase family protein [Terriglobales bacterium]
MIRTVLMLGFWGALLPVAAVLGFSWTLITGNVSFLYRMGMWGAGKGIRVAGIKVRTVGLERLDPAKTYVFMSNHASNIDPPLLLPFIPRRTSVMAKNELFSYPLLGRMMRFGSLVPVDRGNREAGIAAVRYASQVIRSGINMTIFVEGHRSFDGKLLPFKKGPFYLAEECGVPVVPVSIVGTHFIMPKRRFAIRPGIATVIFHDAIEPKDFGSRECLMQKVRRAIDSGLPPEMQERP